MIIHAVESTRIGDEILISSRIEMRGRGKPQNLWFRFPTDSAPALDCDPFVVALLLPAMQHGEDIEVRSSISTALLDGLKRYCDVFHRWFPERFKRIEIHPRTLRPDIAASAPGSGAAFSGGVDSFYTFLTLQPKLTHTIFMAGFDMPCNLTQSIAELKRSFAEMMRQCGVRFIAGSTNIRTFVDTVDWTNAHGPALIATALFFGKQFGEFFIPSSYTDGAYPQWGTHPELDPLLSTTALRFVHHGNELNRVQKLQVISRFPQSYERLRVCWIQDIGLKNCGRCEKCVRTQVALGIIGALARYRTFDKHMLDHSRIRSLPLRTHQSRVFAHELLAEALRRGRLSICVSLAYSLLRREFFYRTR